MLILWLVIGGLFVIGSIRKVIKDKDVLIILICRMVIVFLIVLLVSYVVFVGFVYGKIFIKELVVSIGILFVFLVVILLVGVLLIYLVVNDYKYIVYVV